LVLALIGIALGVLVFDGAVAYFLRHPARVKDLPPPVYTLIRNVYMRGRRLIQYDESCSRYDEELGWTLKPGACRFANSEFAVDVRVNGLGLRDSEDSLRGPRTIVLGDSFAMGWGVPEDDTFARIIARETGTRVLNAGISGYGTVREMRLLDRLDLSRLSTLIVEYCPNDYDDDNRDFLAKGGVFEPMPRAEYADIVARHRRHLRYYPGKYALDVSAGASAFLRTPVPPYGEAPSAEAEAAAFVNALAHAGRARLDGVRIIVFSVAGDPKFSAAARAALRSLRSPSWVKTVEFFDLPDAVHSSGTFILDNHWNSRGHALVAEALLSRLRRE